MPQVTHDLAYYMRKSLVFPNYLHIGRLTSFAIGPELVDLSRKVVESTRICLYEDKDELGLAVLMEV